LVKNIAEPVRIYHLILHAAAAGKTVGASKKAQPKWRWLAIKALQRYRRRQRGDSPLAMVPRRSMPHANLRADDGRSFGRRVAAGQLQIRDLFVIARNSSFAYRGKPCDMRRMRDLIEGSVQRGVDAMRVNIQIRGDRRPHLGESL
jgi:TolB-like protein